MNDRVPLYPGRVILTPVLGQENTYDMMRADQPTQEGDPLNKATLLKDTTAALFGKDNTAVPDDVLAILSKAILNGDDGYTDVNGIAVPQVKIATGSYVGTGTYGSSNPCSLTFDKMPIIVFIGSANDTLQQIPFFRPLDMGYVAKQNASTKYINRTTWTDNSLSWYQTALENADFQLNRNGVTYNYVAFLL